MRACTQLHRALHRRSHARCVSSPRSLLVTSSGAMFSFVCVVSQGATMRGGGPIEFAQVKHMVGVEAIAEHFLEVWRNTSAGRKAAANAANSASSSSSKADDLPPPLEPRD